MISGAFYCDDIIGETEGILCRLTFKIKKKPHSENDLYGRMI